MRRFPTSFDAHAYTLDVADRCVRMRVNISRVLDQRRTIGGGRQVSALNVAAYLRAYCYAHDPYNTNDVPVTGSPYRAR